MAAGALQQQSPAVVQQLLEKVWAPPEDIRHTLHWISAVPSATSNLGRWNQWRQDRCRRDRHPQDVTFCWSPNRHPRNCYNVACERFEDP